MAGSSKNGFLISFRDSRSVQCERVLTGQKIRYVGRRKHLREAPFVNSHGADASY